MKKLEVTFEALRWVALGIGLTLVCQAAVDWLSDLARLVPCGLNMGGC